MKEIFDFYSETYKVEWGSLEEEVFLLYFNDNKYRLSVDEDVIYLEKYSKLFRYWLPVTHTHPKTLENVYELIDYFINKKTRKK